MSVGEDASVQNYLDLFDPSKDPMLKPGWVSEAYSASDTELANAAQKLKERRAKWSWRLFGDAELVAITQKRAELEQAATKSTAEPEAEHRDRPGVTNAAQRLDDLRLLEGAIQTRHAAFKPLSFYDDCVLVHIEPANDEQEARRWLMVGYGAEIVRLGNQTAPIHSMNARGVRLTDDNVEEYAAFFCSQTVFSSENLAPSAFVPVEEDGKQALSFPACLDAKTYDTRGGDSVMNKLLADPRLGGVNASTRHASSFPKATIGFPLTAIGKSPDHDDASAPADWLLIGTLLYRGEAFRTVLSVAPKGTVTMLQENKIMGAGLWPVSMSWPANPGGVKAAEGQEA